MTEKGVETMKIAVDAMGGDHAPQAIVEDCINGPCCTSSEKR